MMQYVQQLDKDTHKIENHVFHVKYTLKHKVKTHTVLQMYAEVTKSYQLMAIVSIVLMRPNQILKDVPVA